jgi:hemoglobin
MSTEPESLFDRMGGATGVAEIVNEMYERVLADPELAPFFENVSMDRLRGMQYQFVASALDGPVDYTGAELTAIHGGRGINAHYFAKFCHHFANAIETHGATPNDLDQALGRLAIYKDRITGEANYDG